LLVLRLMDKDWLKKKITREQAEAEFGVQDAEWRKLVATMRDGDELWSFSSDAESWELLSGCAGIALVREGAVIESIETEIS
jgi:hypothetical protein